jgi:DNA-binding LacI/PurR family transcriptional regulator
VTDKQAKANDGTSQCRCRRRRDRNTIPLDSIHSYFTTSFLNSLLTSGASKNYSIRFLSDSDMHDIEENGNCRLKFDVVIWALPRPEDIARIEKLVASGIKVVVANRHIYGSSLPFVAINQYSGTRELVSRLVNAGHRRIGCVTSDLPYRYLSERWRGFCDALREADIELDDKLALHVTDSSNIRPGLENLFEPTRYDRSVPDGEIFHRQTFDYIKQTGKKIPEDIRWQYSTRLQSKISKAESPPWNNQFPK